MKAQISKLYSGTPPYTQGQSDEIAAYKSPPLPETLVIVRTSNRKLDATLSRVLNRHPKFREAAERIWKKRLNKSAWKCPYPYSDGLVK